ncbi:MAG TPA: sugar phosphate isomerase/epimerase [Pseudonocardiaceae bacterium]
MDSNRSLARRSVLAGAAVVATGLVAMTLPGTAAAGGHGAHRPGRVPRGQISIQLYTLRDLLDRDLEGTLAELAAIGYRKVELAGTYGRTAAELRAILDRHGLHATSSHVGIDGDWDKAVEDALTLGQRFVAVPWADFPTADEWRRFADQLNAAGEVARAAGLSLGYHNHAHEFRTLEGVRPYDILTSRTDPKLVHLEVDLYWAVDAGVDPVELIHRHAGRIRQFHVKDRGRDGGFADLGTGTIDFGRIFRHAHKAGVIEYIVEHDAPTDALHTARVGYEYLSHFRF